MSHIVTAITFMAGLTLALALILIFVNRKFFVKEDKRIQHIEDMLPHTNCGACGYPGCRAFAEALVKQEVLPGKCNVSSATDIENIANYLDVDTGNIEKLVARLACAGGNNVARYRAEYSGPASCQSSAQVSGGAKVCTWGCLGFGDCKAVCTFDAIQMDTQDLPQIIEDKCTGCGDCVKACPKDLLSLEPLSHRLWVACKNELSGDSLLDMCEVACTACGRCALDAPAGLISMQNNLPTIIHSQDPATQVAIERCSTGAIVWLNSDNTVTKGRESKRIVQHDRLPVTMS